MFGRATITLDIGPHSRVSFFWYRLTRLVMDKGPLNGLLLLSNYFETVVIKSQ